MGNKRAHGFFFFFLSLFYILWGVPYVRYYMHGIVSDIQNLRTYVLILIMGLGHLDASGGVDLWGVLSD